MSSTNVDRTSVPVARKEHGWGHPITGLFPGLAGGFLMLVVVCLLALAQRQDFFRPILVIASTIMGAEALSGGVGTVAIGLGVHFLVSALLGMVFIGFFGRTTMLRLLALGFLYGVGIWGVSQFLLLPLFIPHAAIHVGIVGPSFLGNLAYGLMLAACAPTIKDIDVRIAPDDAASREELQADTPRVATLGASDPSGTAEPAPARPSLAQRYGDGQPLGRALQEEAAARTFEEKVQEEHNEAVAHLQKADSEARAKAATNDPDDYQGPPPIVGFP